MRQEQHLGPRAVWKSWNSKHVPTHAPNNESTLAHTALQGTSRAIALSKHGALQTLPLCQTWRLLTSTLWPAETPSCRTVKTFGRLCH